MQVDHQGHVWTQRPAQRAHFIDDTLRYHRGELDGAKPLRYQLLCERDALGQGRARQARCIGWNTGAARTPEQFHDRLAGHFSREIPQRDVDACDRVGVKAPPVPPDAHQGVEIVPDRWDVHGLASDKQWAQNVADDRDDGLRRDNPVGLAPADGAVARRDLDQHRAVDGRVDGPIAAANEVTALVDLLALAQRPQIWHVSRQRDDDGLNRADHSRHQFATAP